MNETKEKFAVLFSGIESKVTLGLESLIVQNIM